jgi:hypothetical protein
LPEEAKPAPTPEALPKADLPQADDLSIKEKMEIERAVQKEILRIAEGNEKAKDEAELKKIEKNIEEETKKEA